MWLPSASDLALPFVIQPLQALHHSGYFAFSREDFCLLGTPSYSFHCTYTIIPVCMVIQSLKTVVVSHPLSCMCIYSWCYRENARLLWSRIGWCLLCECQRVGFHQSRTDARGEVQP